MSDGKFTNTEIVNALDTVIDSFYDRLQNPFYNFNNEKGMTVTYYNLDKNNYPLDDVTGMQYSSVGPLSETKYNKIKNFILYGVDKVLITLNDTDEGTEADEISGTAIILPNTIHPYAGDYFTINHDKYENVLFRVIDAQSDTFTNGANVWEINYKVEHVSDDEINKYNVGVESTFLLNNVGTEYTTVIEDSKLETVKRIEETHKYMVRYYKGIFYNDRVQALIFKNSVNSFYDSFLTEFVIHNKILSERNNFVYISHQLPVSNTFDLDYSRSFFKCIEDKNIKKFKNSSRIAFGELIDNKTSIFASRYESYLNMNYSCDLKNISDNIAPGLIFEIFDEPLLVGIQNNKLFGNDILSDLIIKYFNDDIINEQDLDALDRYNYTNNPMQFYYVPIVIFILEYYIKVLMNVTTNKS